MLDGKLTPYIQKVLSGEMTSGSLANALKTAINSVYGLTSAKFENPFKDARVRQAFYQAIDIEAIKKRIMRDAANPLALMVAPGINGFDEALNKRPPFDPELHQAMAEQPAPPGVAPGSVVACWTPAWTLNGRLLKPAMVVVAR